MVQPARPWPPPLPRCYAWAEPPWWWPPADVPAAEVDAWLAAAREVDAEGVPERMDEQGRFLPFTEPYERHYLRTAEGGCCFGGTPGLRYDDLLVLLRTAAP